MFFSTWTVFSTPSIFIVYWWDRNAPYTFESNIDVQSTWILPNVWPVISIDFSSFSWANYTGLANKYITLSWATSNGTFRFWDNLNLDGSLDKAVYNLRNIIRENFEDFNAYIFYPNTCTIWESLFMYDSNKDTSFLFPRDLLGNCDATHISSSQTGITLTWTHILSYDESMTLKPQYTLKIKDSESTASGHLLFSDLKSLRVPYFWVRLWGSWYSSIYNVGVRVVWVEYWQIKSDQFIQSYITDSDY